MSEDRPLTDFADASEDGADSEQEVTDSEAQEAADSETQATAIDDTEPATPTYRWQPDGAVCEACGEPTERGWRDDEGFVCPDCKSW